MALAGIVAMASCEKEELTDSSLNEEGVTTLTLSFDDTKTTLDGGKTRWAAGDVIRIYSSKGVSSQDYTVTDADAGKSSIQVEVNMRDKNYYVVYPAKAANGIKSDKPVIRIPSDPDGRFASANICAAYGSSDEPLKMHNVTAVMKINVNSGNVIEVLQLTAQNDMTGTYTVDLSGANPVLSPEAASKSAKIAVGAIDGDYYVAVAPGTYQKDFSITALRGNGGYQTLRSVSENVVPVNTIMDMGVIGNKLSKGLEGEGTESNPYRITNIGEYTAFSSSVNLGNAYSSKFISLAVDIEDVQTPVGYYINSEDYAAFGGHFLGNNHTISIDIDSDANSDTNDYMALFGILDEGASINGLNVSGTVKSKGKYAAGLLAYSKGSIEKTADGKEVYSNNIADCSSSVVVSGNDCVAGIVGYALKTNIKNCKNTGNVSGKYNVAGIVGYFYQGNAEKCTNEGAITATEDCGGVLVLPQGVHRISSLNGDNQVSTSETPAKAVGGISGWTQNVTLNECTNKAAVTGISKVGGVSGALYWSTSNGNANTGTITATRDFVGGIAGWAYTNSNNVEDVNVGAVTGRAAVGGILGMSNNGRSAGTITVKDCRNNGAVNASDQTAVWLYNNNNNSHIDNAAAAGGIVGLACEYEGHVTKLSNNVNAGNVYGKGTAVGGIIGLRTCPLNNTRGGFVDGCINSGKVESGLHRAGGIVGMDYQRFTSSVFIIVNCENHGIVKAPNVVGGIVAYMSTTWPTTNASDVTGYHETVFNCYNDGEIIYTPDSYNPKAGPYASGIVGFTRQGLVENVVNYGNVHPSSGSANLENDLFLGETIGFMGRITEVNYLYCLSSTANPMLYAANGTSEVLAQKIGEVQGKFKADGNLDQPVLIGSKTYNNITEALNNWASINRDNEEKVFKTSFEYKKWKNGPKGPVFED